MPENFDTFQPTMKIHCSVNIDSLAKKIDDVETDNFDALSNTISTKIKQLEN